MGRRWESKATFFTADNQGECQAHGLLGHATPHNLGWGFAQLQLTPPQAPILLDYNYPKHERRRKNSICKQIFSLCLLPSALVIESPCAALPELCLLGNNITIQNWTNMAMDKRSIAAFIEALNP